MSADTSSVRYQCPFCEYDGPSARAVKSHVTETEQGRHMGIDGYTMSQTITVTEDPSELPMIERIEKAGQQFDEPLSYDNAEQVAEAAQDSDDHLSDVVSKHMVLRVWDESEYEVNIHTSTSLYYDELSDQQQDILRHIYHTDKLKAEVARTLDLYDGRVGKVYRKYGYMTTEHFISDSLANDVPDTASESDQESTEVVESQGLVISALSDSGVDYDIDITIQDDDFDAVKKLIKNGYEDIAEDFFDQ